MVQDPPASRSAQIEQALQRHPGLNLRQLIRATDLSSGTLRRTLEPMVEAGQVRRFQSPRGDELVFFLATDAVLWEREATRVLFGQGATRRVALALVELGSATVQELSDRLDRHVVTVRQHLDVLERRGLATAHGGQPRRYEVSSPLKRWVESFEDRLPGGE